MSPYNYLSNKNSVYNTAPPCKKMKGNKKTVCVWLACVEKYP